MYIYNIEDIFIFLESTSVQVMNLLKEAIGPHLVDHEHGQLFELAHQHANAYCWFTGGRPG